MNADDMSEPVFGSFYRPSALSKAAPLHTTSLMGAQMREGSANRALLRTRRILESFNSADLGDRQNQLLLRLFRWPRGQSFGLKNCKRQNRHRNGLMRQSEQDRNLIEQRENAQSRLQRYRHRQP